eukprot:jgi/Antlo1/807/215
MLFLWIAASAQKVVLLDDLGLLGPKSSTGQAVPGSLFQKSRSTQESAYDNEKSMQNRRESDAREVIRQYLTKEYARPLGIDDGEMEEIRRLAVNRGTLEGNRNGRHHIGTKNSNYAGKHGTFSQIPGSIDIDVPYRSQESSPRNRPEQYSENARGIETGTNPRSGHLSGSRDGNMRTDSSMRLNSTYSSASRGVEDGESTRDFERNARESAENANSARESYLEVKIRESRGRESKIAEELSKVDEQIEALVSSLGETRVKAQNTQIDLLNRRNSVKNMIARREASEKAVRKLSAEMRILNNEVVRLSKELDEKRIRLENLSEDVNMQNNRVRSIEDELISRNSEVEQDEVKKNDLNKDIIRIENAIAKLKEEREGLTHEKSRESRVQAKIQREIDKIGEIGVFV